MSCASCASSLRVSAPKQLLQIVITVEIMAALATRWLCVRGEDARSHELVEVFGITASKVLNTCTSTRYVEVACADRLGGAAVRGQQPPNGRAHVTPIASTVTYGPVPWSSWAESRRNVNFNTSCRPIDATGSQDNVNLPVRTLNVPITAATA
jgi:hypothetical protein